MRKITIPVIIFLVIMLFMLQVDLKALMAGNESDGAYSPPPPKSNGVVAIGSITLRQLIADGGNHLFKSAGSINQFFSLVESSEVIETDYRGMQKTINEAIFYLEKARVTYLQLKNLAAVTPYNQDVIFSLVSFNYDSFQEENGLFPVIFEKVKSFLAKGDVTGIYNEFYSYTGDILNLLYTLKKDIDLEIFPDISTVWSINQKYSEIKLFGQYVAQVFYRIKYS